MTKLGAKLSELDRHDLLPTCSMIHNRHKDRLHQATLFDVYSSKLVDKLVERLYQHKAL